MTDNEREAQIYDAILPGASAMERAKTALAEGQGILPVVSGLIEVVARAIEAAEREAHAAGVIEERQRLQDFLRPTMADGYPDPNRLADLVTAPTGASAMRYGSATLSASLAKELEEAHAAGGAARSARNANTTILPGASAMERAKTALAEGQGILPVVSGLIEVVARAIEAAEREAHAAGVIEGQTISTKERQAIARIATEQEQERCAQIVEHALYVTHSLVDAVREPARLRSQGA